MKKKYCDYKTKVKTSPSIASLINFQLSPCSSLLTVSRWDDLSISSYEYVDQRPRPASPPTHRIRTIVQSTWFNQTQRSEPKSHYDDSFHIRTETEDENFVGDISIQADKPRLCQAKQAHTLVLGKPHVSLVMKLLTSSDVPHLDTKALIQILDDVAKAKDLDVLTILAEQLKYQIVGIVRSWMRKY